jgi:hypothetical protein
VCAIWRTDVVTVSRRLASYESIVAIPSTRCLLSTGYPRLYSHVLNGILGLAAHVAAAAGFCPGPYGVLPSGVGSRVDVESVLKNLLDYGSPITSSKGRAQW